MRSRLLLLMLILSACENSGTPLPTLSPMLFLTPAPGLLVFDRVVLPGDSTHTVTAQNIGEQPLVFDSITLEGDEAFTVNARLTELSRLESRAIELNFEPTQPGLHTATLIIKSNDPSRATVRYPLEGLATEPCLSVSPTTLSFPPSRLSTITIEAIPQSQGTCQVIALNYEETYFDVEAPTLPLRLEPGERIELPIEQRSTTFPQSANRLTVMDADRAEYTVTLQGAPTIRDCVALTPDELFFPATSVGESATQIATVSNTCNQPATVTEAVVTGGAQNFSVVPQSFPMELPPGTDLLLTVRFAPAFADGHSGTLVVRTNDTANPSLNLRLLGEGVAQRLDIFPRRIDFGAVDAQGSCNARPREVHFYNYGASDVTIERLELDAPFVHVATTVQNLPLTPFETPFVVPAGEGARMELEFRPTPGTSTEAAIMSIHHSAGAPVDVALLGRGVSTATISDRFEQEPSTDILWVVDNSCSMGDEQTRLVASAPDFLNSLVNTDYQMAVTVPDSQSDRAGELRQCAPHPRILSADYADASTRELALECLLGVGTSGSVAREAGLGAAMRALQRNVSPNTGLIRAEATLQIIIVSDEDDQSLENDAHLRDFFFGLKNFERHRVAVHAIAGPITSPCPAGSNASPGFRYHTLSKQTGGQTFAICELDYVAFLETLAASAFSLQQSWTLSAAAVSTSISVQVDDIPVPADPLDGYVFDPGENTVSFFGASIPGRGASISVDYTARCQP